MSRIVQARGRVGRQKSAVPPSECAITVAAALEVLVLVGGLLWAINAPPGAPLWPRIVLVTVLAAVTAIGAILACAPLFRQQPSDRESEGIQDGPGE